MPDVTMDAICPSQDHCSLAIFLSGFQQAVTGVGLVVMMPVIGRWSDVYGRKALMTVPMTACIVPVAILAVRRTEKFYYAYFVCRTLSGIVCDGAIQCLALAYVADRTTDGQRASAIGILAAIGSAAFVCGTLAARFFSTPHIFMFATVVSLVAAVYMRIFLSDTTPCCCCCNMIQSDATANRLGKTSEPEKATENGSAPLLLDYHHHHHHHHKQQKNQGAPNNTTIFNKKPPSPVDIFRFLKNSGLMFSLAASIAFLNSVAEGGEQAPFQYYLKARFHFKKNNFADIMLINNLGSTLSQLLLFPMLAPLVGEEVLLCIGLCAGFCNMFVNSIAWSIWVPYVASLFPILISLVKPGLQTIVSKQVGRNEQGTAQGCISGLSSFGNIISPLIFSPLTALFLSDAAPFPYQGFSILCVGIAWLIAFVPGAMMVKLAPLTPHPPIIPVVPSSDLSVVL
ncbi:unnamed protein product [Cuscuta campestris]|uniref:Major facilitator superfamily (MFS) profile domain-containing protein n=1 Tax=Cuscuta campestris TaxID=132261 RepID=A0A484LPN2_9ASTE|nr:unnamed protein product [Cuscuta campestris]